MPAVKIKLKQAALWYAKFNWYVFPVAANNKHPLTENGFKDASIDPAIIDAWWEKWPDANIGLACDMSGVIVLDGDPNHYSEDSAVLMAALREDYPTATQSTPTDGLHLIYTIPPGEMLNNSRGNLPPGIDVRANGYILLAPSSVTYHGDKARSKGVEDEHFGRYRWLEKPDLTPPQPLPAHVLELLKKPEYKKPDMSSTSNHANTNGYHGGDNEHRYARAALDREIQILRSTPSGDRNNQLNVSAMKLAQLVAGGELDESEVVGALEETALAIGLESSDIKGTIRSGMKKGKTEPRRAPEMPRLKFRRRDDEAQQNKDESSSSDELTVEVLAPNVFDYVPEDGGLVDAWHDTLSNDWIYVTGYEAWYGWTGAHWLQDETLYMPFQLEEMFHVMNEQARKATAKAKADGDENKEKAFRTYVATTKRSRSRVMSVEALARPKRARSASMLDTGNVLNLLNGTLDLDNLILREHHRSDMLTYTLPYEYDFYAICPRFKQFVDEVLVKENGKTPDHDLALLCQELVGYSLTQDTSQEAMVWLAGEGGNGKTVMITVLSKLLGPLAIGVDFQTIGVAGNYDLANLPGKRIVFSTESERGGHMAEGYIKRIVSGEMINARPIYGKPFFFQSAAKIWWAMNDKPTVKDTSNALHRRLKLIPFYRVFKDSERDVHLIDKLGEELPGILNWALSGLLRLRAQGQFTVAAAVDAAKDEFRYESNPVAQWLRECTESGGSTVATLAYENYSRWCTRSNNKELTSNAFGRELTRLNIGSEQKRTGKMYPFALHSEPA